MRITLADVIARRRELSPREAATLTLAVGREWDRARTEYGNIPLPDPSAIELTETGALTFLEPACEPQANVVGASLVALFGQLLGLGEGEAPRRDIPRRLLITIASPPGSIETPSIRDDGFRSALFQFADADPLALAHVFWRLTGPPLASELDSEHVARLRVHRGPDRRRQSAVISELRREIRRLERHTFEARSMPSPPSAPWRTRLAWPAIAVCASVLLGVTGFIAGAGRSTDLSPVVQQAGPSLTPLVVPAPEPVTNVTPPPRTRMRAAVSAPTIARPPASRAAVSAPPVVTPSTGRVAVPASVAVAVVHRSSTPAGVSQPPVRPTRTPAHVTFAGGTRGIVWMQAAN